jgi:hypothetical protein
VRSRTTKRFRAAFEALPEQAKKQARQAYRIFLDNPFHPSLSLKSIESAPEVDSVRVGLHYRAWGTRQGDAIIWFWIGSHADSDTILSRR